MSKEGPNKEQEHHYWLKSFKTLPFYNGNFSANILLNEFPI